MKVPPPFHRRVCMDPACLNDSDHDAHTAADKRGDFSINPRSNMTAIDQLDKVMDQAETVVQASIPPTAVFLVLDESTSMGDVREATIGGVNDFLAEQAKQPGLCYFSLTKFASRVDQMGAPVEIGSFPKLTTQTYKPNGNTALYDAIAVTIERAEEWFALQSGPVQMLFVIQTDGQENNSVDHNAESIRKLIGKKTEDKWDFVFLGADQDAILAAGAIGIQSNMTATYTGSKAGTRKAFSSTSDSVSMLRSHGRDDLASFYNTDDLGE